MATTADGEAEADAFWATHGVGDTPLVGLNVGAIYGAGIHDDAIFGPEVGLKYFVNESTFVYGNIAYEVPFDECCKDGVVPYALGIGFNF